MIRFFCIAMLLLGFEARPLQAQNLDSLEQALPQMEPNFEKFKLLTDLAWAYSRAAPYRSLQFSEQALDLAKLHLGEEEQVLVNYYFGTAHKNLGNHAEALEYFNAYAAYFEQQEDLRKVCFVRYQTGATKEMMGDYAGALADLYVNLRLARQLGYKDTEATTLNTIATIYRKMKDYEKALATNQEAYILYQDLGDKRGMGMVMANNANAYTIRGFYEIALENYRSALALFMEVADEYMLEHTYLNMGNLMVKMKRWDEAEPFFAKSLTLSQQLGHSKVVSEIYLGLGSIALETNKPLAAIPYFRDALAIAQSNSALENQIIALRGMARSHEAAGQYRESAESYKLLNVLSDSMLNEEIVRQVAELNVQYETERKETQIALLQKDKVLSQRKQGLWALAAAILLLIALGVIVLYRNRQKNIRSLQEKNRVISHMLEDKEYLIKEIHHRVKNNLQIISSLLQLQSRYVEEPTALAALNDGESRVRSMSIIHHHLYTDEHLSRVKLPVYIQNLCDNLQASYSIKGKPINIHQSVADLSLDVSVMIPLGLIINELITNAFKYAFHHTESGNIWVTIAEGARGLHVEVRDDGVGMDPTTQQGFGSRLIRSFLRKLNAEAETDTTQGTTVKVFVKDYQVDSSKVRSA